jgi:hypothetical protein
MNNGGCGVARQNGCPSLCHPPIFEPAQFEATCGQFSKQSGQLMDLHSRLLQAWIFN